MTIEPIPPAERLAASRERLRQALAPGGAASAADAGRGDFPGASTLLLDALGGAWARHPLGLAADIGRGALQPLAQRHPRSLVLAAALLGAGVVWARPWRGVLRPALLAGLLPLALKSLHRLPPGFWAQLLAPRSQKA